MSENMGFKSYLTMSWAEMTDYIGELETRVRNADSGAKLWKDELMAAKAGKAAAEVVAKMHADAVETLADVAQRKVSALADMVESAQHVCTSWAEYDIALRIFHDRVQSICYWLNKHHHGFVVPQMEQVDTEDPSDIPF